MRIKLTGFRCHVDSTYSFQEGMVSLLKGPSGVGKSTIFTAILWALYGGMQHIYNNAGATNKCSVTLELDTPKILVYRQKRPELLKITLFEGAPGTPTYIENNYEDQVAQSILNGLFGTREVWLACCYIPQGTRSYLLTAANSDKMELLNVLSFNTEMPDTYLAKIDTELSNTTAAFYSTQTSYTTECDQFNLDINAAQLDMTLYVSPEERQVFAQECEQNKVQLAECTIKYNEQQRQRGILFSLRESKTNLERQLTSIVLPKEDEVPRLEAELEILNVKASSLPYLSAYQRYQNEKEVTLKQLDRLASIEDTIENPITEMDVSRAFHEQQQYQDNTRLCSSLNCSYDRDTITHEIAHLTSLIEVHPKLLVYSRLLSERDETETRLAALPALPSQYSLREVSEAEIAATLLQQQQYDQAILQCKALSCSYSEEDINAEITKLNAILALQPKIATHNKIRNDRNAVDHQLNDVARAISAMGLPSLPVFSDRPVTEEDVSEAFMKMTQYEEGKNLADSLQVAYNETTVSQEIARLSAQVDLQPRLQMLVRYLTLQHQMRQLLMANNDRLVPEEEMLAARDALGRLHASLDIQKCPHCSGPIRSINGRLLPGESLPPTPEEIAEKSNHLQIVTLQRKRSIEIEGLQREIDSLKKLCDPDNVGNLADIPAPLNPTDLAAIKHRITLLSKIRFGERPAFSPQLLRLLRTQHTLEERRSQLSSEMAALEKEIPPEKLNQPPVDIPSLQGRIAGLSKIRIVACPSVSPEILRRIQSENLLLGKRNEITARITQMMLEIPSDKLMISPNMIDVGATRSRISALSQIRVVQPPAYPPEFLQSILQKRKLLTRLTEVEAEIAKLPALDLLLSLDATNISTNITRIKKRLAEIASDATRHKMLSHQIQDIEAKIESIVLDDSLGTRISQLTTAIETASSRLAINEKIDFFLNRQAKLEKKRADLEVLYKDMTTLTRLKTLAREVECHTLQNMVDSVNAALSDIATHLFDDPIAISLQLFKTLKTSDRVKPTVNISINYRGGEYDNIMQLSGGEGDRISLAIVLALARISGCPLLLLDECMASLDANLKEACLKAIKRNLGNGKTVITINHEGTEGTYDNVVAIGNG